MSFGESSESENPSTSELLNDGKQSQGTTKACAGASSTDKKPAQQSVAVEDALAGEEATRVFHNAALSTEERILASKVRIASGILEHLDRPEVAATDCLQYVRELHDMPAIKEIFSVHVGTGIKSWFKSGFKKNSRAEIVETVTMINLILADFTSKFTKRRMAVFDWPMIECGKRVVHPIHFKNESAPNVKEMQITPPWDTVVSDNDMLTGASNEGISVQKTLVLTTEGDLIYFTDDRRSVQKLDTTTGKLQPYCLSPLEDNTEHSQPSGVFIGIAIDDNDTVYVLSRDDKDGIESELNYIITVYIID
ncbi:Hypothetical predicted protein [Paramuricea clavata]|uniref:Uncharacterized protein n=1 Tax=Paramuricea clavata TaxID=317549 RepID=A0A7D9IWD9_PARCT|nr:Hypothetical predicted protein [Paramuricea clavata]